MSKDNCHPNYYEDIYRPWVYGDRSVEHNWRGVHEFRPQSRGDAYTQKFEGSHPEVIERDIEDFRNRIQDELLE